VLERDGYICRINGPKCTMQATDVDHIIPVEDGGPLYDPENLRAACHWCNSWRGNMQREREGWRRNPAHIILVVGPAGAGQQAYVEEHAGPSDMIVDYGKLHSAMRGVSYKEVNAARNALLNRVRRGDVKAPRVWITSANPEAEAVLPHHEVVRLGEFQEAGRRVW
jgi:hypothetical protein